MAEVSSAPIWETTESIQNKTNSLGNLIIQQTFENPDLDISGLVVVPRGGLFVANILSRKFGMDGCQVLSMGLSKYGVDHPTQPGEFKVGQLPHEEMVEGRTLLLVDEVYDTGETVEKAKGILYDLGASCVLSAVVHYKPGENTTNLAPDFYVEETNGWVHYPWEEIDPDGAVYRSALRNQRIVNCE